MSGRRDARGFSDTPRAASESLRVIWQALDDRCQEVSYYVEDLVVALLLEPLELLLEPLDPLMECLWPAVRLLAASTLSSVGLIPLALLLRLRFEGSTVALIVFGAALFLGSRLAEPLESILDRIQPKVRPRRFERHATWRGGSSESVGAAQASGVVGRPPGMLLLRVAQLVFSRKTCNGVFEPLIADLHEDYFDALGAKAGRIRLGMIRARFVVLYVSHAAAQGLEVLRPILAVAGVGGSGVKRE